MSELIDIVCVRVAAVLEEYAHTGILPHLLLCHTVTIDDLEHCFDQLTPQQQSVVVSMIRHYVDHMRENLHQLKQQLRADYTHTLDNLQTRSTEFQFPTVLARYRNNINPTTALYYDVREVVRGYNPDDDRHVWLHGLLADRAFNNKILDALSADMRSLEKIVKDYQWPLRKLDKKIPLEIFHARQIIKDFSNHYVLFAGLPSWDPEQ
jgi:hypothetical protein